MNKIAGEFSGLNLVKKATEAAKSRLPGMTQEQILALANDVYCNNEGFDGEAVGLDWFVGRMVSVQQRIVAGKYRLGQHL